MKKLALIYSCSGSSNVAQAANAVAVALDREGIAEMSCIAGVGAGVASLVRVAKSGRSMVVIDGCPLACSRHALEQNGITPDVAIDLSSLGFRKVQHSDLSAQEIASIREDVVLPAVKSLMSERCEEVEEEGGIAAK